MKPNRVSAFSGNAHVIFGWSFVIYFTIIFIINPGIYNAKSLTTLVLLIILTPAFALLPDIDIRQSTINYKLPWLNIIAKPIQVMGHRKITHSLTFCLMIALGLAFTPTAIAIMFVAFSYVAARKKIPAGLNLIFAVVCSLLSAFFIPKQILMITAMVGLLSHLVGDMTTAKIKPFYPIGPSVGAPILPGKTHKAVIMGICIAVSAPLLIFKVGKGYSIFDQDDQFIYNLKNFLDNAGHKVVGMFQNAGLI